MAETTPGAPPVKPIVMKAAQQRLKLTGQPLSAPARPKKQQSQVTIKAPMAKY